MSIRGRLVTACAIATLAVPAAAIAKPGHGHGNPGHGHATGVADNPGAGHRHDPIVTYVFKGTFDGASSVEVAHGNAFVRKGGMVGTTVQFDLTNTKLTVADTNGDAVTDATDVLAGDKVVVKARLPKSDPGPDPFTARHLVDQTHPPADSQSAD
jgi:hypothetical protein